MKSILHKVKRPSTRANNPNRDRLLCRDLEPSQHRPPCTRDAPRPAGASTPNREVKPELAAAFFPLGTQGSSCRLPTPDGRTNRRRIVDGTLERLPSALIDDLQTLQVKPFAFAGSGSPRPRFRRVTP
jgi:hypothetical protein